MESLEQSCCLCFSAGDCHISLFNNTVSDLNMAEVIELHFQCKVDDSDPFPNAICENCWVKTVSFNKFHQFVISSRKKFLEKLIPDVVKEECSFRDTMDDFFDECGLEIKTEPMVSTSDEDEHNDNSYLDLLQGMHPNELMTNSPTMEVKNEKADPLEYCEVEGYSSPLLAKELHEVDESDLQKIKRCRQDVEMVQNIYDSVNKSDAHEEASQSKQIVARESTSKKNLTKWKHYKTFRSKIQLQQFLSLSCWSSKNRKIGRTGTTTTYRCNLVPLEGPQCAATLKVYEPNNALNFHVFLSESDHSHQKITCKKMPPDIKFKIIELRRTGMKAKAIQSFLEKNSNGAGCTPSYRQIVNYLTYTKLIDQKCSISLSELTKWMESRSKPPLNSDDPFIIKYSHSNTGNPSKYFRFVASTRRLLKNATNISTICAEGASKIVWNGFPLFAIGTTDMVKQFHPIAVALCANENIEDFEFIFETIKNAVLFYNQQKFEPKVLITDDSDAIINAFYRVFETASNTIMCYAHVSQNVVRQKLVNNVQTDIKADLNVLQLAPNKKLFETGVKLFLKKWKSSEPEFCDNFKAQYVDRNSNWYEGAVSYTPSTNNALGAFNNVLKTVYSLRERQPLSEFKKLFFKMLLAISTKYKQRDLKFVRVPIISQSEWRKGIAWAADTRNAAITVKEDDERIEFIIPSSEHYNDQNRQLTWNDIGNYKNQEWKTFEEFITVGFSMWHLKLHKMDWNTKSECSCRQFFKEYNCQHKIGMALRQKLITEPVEEQPDNVNETRGRVSMRRKGLIVE